MNYSALLKRLYHEILVLLYGILTEAMRKKVDQQAAEYAKEETK